ncbi:putative F-box protein [Panicum miliaceum]|uniref:F-box protein n=1 Tax=Panicum miliaceum TaxID=4540 RepID=A0A3L6TD02_PANMI|nr:putative F-box protein [Panicum miliaceum]
MVPFFSLPHSESFQFPESMGYHSSCGEWLVFLCDGTYSLKNPFSKDTLTLPKLSCLCPIEEPEEIVNLTITLEGEMPQGSLDMDAENEIVNLTVIQGGEMPQKSLDMDAEMSVYKLVVCSSLLAAAIVNLGPVYTIALCRPGADSWFISRLLRRDQHIDMMLYGGKLFVLDEFKNLLAN